MLPKFCSEEKPKSYRKPKKLFINAISRAFAIYNELLFMEKSVLCRILPICTINRKVLAPL